MPDNAAVGLAPWRPEQIMSLLTGLGVSATLLAAGWVGASGEAEMTDQYPWLSLAIVGTVAAGVVNARWLLLGLIALRARERELLGPLQLAAQPQALQAVVAADDPELAAGKAYQVVGVPAGRVHRPNCPALQGKPVQAVAVADAAAAGHRQCALCAPR